MIKLNIKIGSQEWRNKNPKETAQIVGCSLPNIYAHFGTGRKNMGGKDMVIINRYLIEKNTDE